jgi:vanillate O-demethylase monooxygenase subunit
MLMVDNLMDLTHLGYLHARTVGGNPGAHVEADMKTVRTSTGLKFTRWMRNSLPPPSYVKAAGFQGRVDRCQEFEFVAPNTILQWTGAADAGTATDNPQRDFRFQFRLFHGLTPETETSCFYFWSAANGYRQNEPEATQALFTAMDVAFREDDAVLEHQYATLRKLGDRPLVNINSDGARIHARLALERKIAAERGIPKEQVVTAP